MKNQKSKLKQKQLDILTLLYKFRFLTRNQIQTMLNHKQFNRVILWLNDLTECKYLYRDFSRKFGPKPSIYCLDIKSREELKSQKDIKVSLLDRVYKEKKLSGKFRKHCIFVANIYLSLVGLAKKNKIKLNFYTKTDLTGMMHLILPIPNAYFSIKESKNLTKRYFLDVFDEQDPRFLLRKRVRQYFNYYSRNYWQDNTNHPFPEIILVCPDKTMNNYLHNFITRMLNEENENITFLLSTWEEIRAQGIKKEVLHKVKM